MGEQHAGYRVGEFWRTRYLAYAERVLIKKKKRRGRGQRGRKCMGQAGYPYVQRVGRQNMWEDHMLLDRFNRNFFSQGILIKQLGQHYLELLAGGFFPSFVTMSKGESSTVPFVLLFLSLKIYSVLSTGANVIFILSRVISNKYPGFRATS